MSWWRRKQRDRDLDDEIRFHLQQEEQHLIDRGEPPGDARQSARRAFGNRTRIQELTREIWGWPAFETILQDIRYALRLMRRSPVFTAVAVLSLALGIGANTAIFSLADKVLVQRLPVKEPGRLLLVQMANPGGLANIFSYPLYEDIRNGNQVLSETALDSTGAFDGPVTIERGSGSKHEVSASATLVSGTFFPVLGVQPVMGRLLSPDDDKIPGAHPVCVVSYRFWKRAFEGSTAIIGSNIAILGHSYRILGVAPPGFFGIEAAWAPDIWVPVMMRDQLIPGDPAFQDRRNYWGYVFGRLKPGVSKEQADANLKFLFEQLVAARKERGRNTRLVTAPLERGTGFLRARFGKPLIMLLATVSLLLLIACSNLAGLLLARASARRREVAVRIAVGAGRRRIIRQFLTEAMLLSACGCLAGLVAANWGSKLLIRMISTARLPIPIEFSLDIRVLGFALAVSLLTGIVVGIIPALNGSRATVGPMIKDSSASERPWTAGKPVMVFQLALSLTLLTGASLLARSLGNLERIDTGFHRENILVLQLDWRSYREYLTDRTRLNNLCRRLLERVQSVPGVRAAAVAQYSFFGAGSVRRQTSWEGHAQPAGENTGSIMMAVTHGFAETLGLRLVAGRDFRVQDDETGPHVAIVTESMAKRLFSNASVIGRRLSFSRTFDPAHAVEVVGVVKDATYGDLRGPVLPILYVPFYQSNQPFLNTVQVRTAGDPSRLSSHLREAVREVDPKLLLSQMTTLERLIEDSIVQDRVMARLSGFFGLLALLLCAIGLYGVTSYSVARRTNEIGVRIALGAARKNVVWMVLREVMLLGAAGAVIGIPAALAATRLLRTVLFGVAPSDPVAIAVATTLLLGVALFAGYLPARRAAQIDPMEALRYD